MPTLPNPAQFNTPIPQSNRGVSSYQTGQVEAANANLAGAIGNFGEAVAKEQDRLDEIKAQEAYNKLREKQLDLTLGAEGYTTVKGSNVINAKVPLVQDYGQKLDNTAEELRNSLVSEGQKKKFQALADREKLSFKAGVLGHMVRESDSYRREVYSGTVGVEQQNAAANWSTPEKISLSRNRIIEATRAVYQKDGIAADKAEGMLRDNLSKMHMGVVEQMISADPYLAEEYLKKNSNEIDPDQLLRANQFVGKEVKTRTGITIGQGAADSLIKNTNAGPATDLWAALIKQESDGQHYDKSGKVTESTIIRNGVKIPGARGVSQIMPGTWEEARNLAGLPASASIDNPDDNMKAGKAYFGKQLQTFGGDVSKALAAYNAGAGAVQRAVEKAAKSQKLAAGDPSVPVKDWLEFMPAETKNYVSKITANASSGQATQAITMAALEPKIREQSGGDPVVYQTAIKQAKMQLDQFDADAKAKQEKLVGDVYTALDKNGGNFDALPASLRSQIPGDKLPALQNYAEQRAKGAPVQTNWAAYYELKTNAQGLAQTNLAALKPHLGDAEFKELTNMQKDIGSGNMKTSIQANTAKEIVDGALTSAKMSDLLSPKAGEDDKKMVTDLRRQVDDKIRALEAATGKPASPQDIQAIVEPLFVERVKEGRIFNSKARSFQVPADQQSAYKVADVAQVPASHRAMIESALKKGGKVVNNASILLYYNQLNK